MTTPRLSLPSALFPLLLTLFSAAAAAETPPGVEVSLRILAPGVVAAPVTVGGTTLWMLVDSGATRSRIRSALAARLGLQPTARYVLAGLDGVEREAFCRGPLAVAVAEFELRVDCLSWSNELAVPLGLDGVLGADVLAVADVLLDHARGRMRVAPAGSLASWVEGAPIPARLLSGRPALAARFAGAAPPGSYLVLDSGTDAPILFGELARDLARRREARRRPGVQTAGGPVEAWTIRLRSLQVGPRAFERLATVLLPAVHDREELGLLPPSLLGPTLFALADGLVVADATLLLRPREPTFEVAALSARPIRLAP